MVPVVQLFVEGLDAKLTDSPSAHLWSTKIVLLADKHGHWHSDIRQVEVWCFWGSVQSPVHRPVVVILVESVVGGSLGIVDKLLS